MIILNNNNTNVNIPDYDDLVNKPSINGVVLEGDKTSQELKINFDTTNFYTKREVNERIADSITGIENEFGNYYTKTQSDSKYQPKGNYLTSIPSEYVTETELNDAIADLGGSDIAYIVVQDEGNDTFSIVSGDLQGVFDAYNNNKPYLIYLPNGISDGYYSLAETVQISGTQLQALSFAHTGTTHTWRYWRIYNNGDVNLYNEISLNYATTTQLNSKQNTLISGANIKTVNGQSLLGSGNITIESGTTIPTMFIPKGYSGSVDLSILTPIYDAVMNNKPWIVWGDLGAANGRYNMVECSTIGDNTITFYDNSVASDNSISIIRYWTFNITDGTFVMEERNIAYATTTQLNSKQDTLVSGDNIKTVNGISLLGSGNITIEGGTGGSGTDLSNYYTKGEVDGLISNLDTSVAENYYTILEVDELVESVEPDLTGYATETWVGNHYQTKGDYATTSYVDTQIGNINTILENIIG